MDSGFRPATTVSQSDPRLALHIPSPTSGRACPSATGHGAAAPTGLETAGFNSILIGALPEELNFRPPDLRNWQEVTDGVAVYRIVGRIDARQAKIWNRLSALTSAVIRGSSLAWVKVAFVSSAGLRIILMTAKQVAAVKGSFAIFGLQSAVNEVFEISGLQKFIPIASDETDARSKLGA
jgi:anti-anti-sigma factor